MNHSFDYDIRLLNQTLLSDNEEQVINSDFIEQIKSIDGVKDVRVLKSATAVVPFQENVYGEYYKELYDSRYSPGNYEKDIELYKKTKLMNYLLAELWGLMKWNLKNK